MKRVSLLLTVIMFLGLLLTVNAQDETAKKAKKLGVQTAETQKAMTPAHALQKLKDGNKRFVAGKVKNQKKYRDQIALTSKGQYPFAAIISCLDSRVVAEDIFDVNNGDVFNARVAGNIVNGDILGSFEFSTKVSGAKLIVVLGHTKCGAVKGACDDVELGNLTGLLAKIEPAVESVGKSWTLGEKNSKNSAYVEAVGEENVRLVMENIKKGSPILKEMIEKGDVLLVGAVYDIETGIVKFMK